MRERYCHSDYLGADVEDVSSAVNAVIIAVVIINALLLLLILAAVFGVVAYGKSDFRAKMLARRVVDFELANLDREL